MKKPAADIRQLALPELESSLASLGEPRYRARQVWEWLWMKSAVSFDCMSSLPKSLREKLSQHYEILPAVISESQKSDDGTIKSAFTLHDGKVVEGVLIPTETRITACISSQAGCSLTCGFCATGRLPRLRNLEAAEIYDQVVLLRKQAEKEHGAPLTNIVYMGMGEPLLNYRNVLGSVQRITSPEGLGLSPKRITVSTAGIARMIRKLGDDEVKFNLALSLHAGNDLKRSSIMPINEQNSLKMLSEALLYFYQKTGNRITCEYILFKNFNDSREDAAELVTFCRQVPCKVNIIEYNPIDNSEFEKADPERTNSFALHLRSQGVMASIRRSRGRDIDAACGQLANKNKPAAAMSQK